MTNKEIRIAAIEYDVPLWKIAEGLSITDASLSRKLRKEISEEEKEHVLSIIRAISEEESIHDR